MPVPASTNDSVMLTCMFAGSCRIVGPFWALGTCSLLDTGAMHAEHASPVHAIWTQEPQAPQVRKQGSPGPRQTRLACCGRRGDLMNGERLEVVLAPLDDGPC